MSKKTDAAVGRLAIMDGVLNGLLRELAVETGVQDPRTQAPIDPDRLTTGDAADKLLGHLKGDHDILTPDVRDWLKRVKDAAAKRNDVIHALAQDQCVLCGNATRFTNRGRSVDRSAEAVAAVSDEFRGLIDEGVRHARAISKTLNDRAIAAARREATATGQVQSPRQILIGQTLHRCGNCSPGGKGIVVVAGPAAVMVLPPTSNPPTTGNPPSFTR